MTRAEPFRPPEFRNGVPLLPRRETAEPLTTDFVKRLLDEEDEEWLRAYRSADVNMLLGLDRSGSTCITRRQANGSRTPRGRGWATCPLTENGFVRSSPILPIPASA